MQRVSNFTVTTINDPVIEYDWRKSGRPFNKFLNWCSKEVSGQSVYLMAMNKSEKKNVRPLPISDNYLAEIITKFFPEHKLVEQYLDDRVPTGVYGIAKIAPKENMETLLDKIK